MYLTENTCEDERVVRLNEEICDAMGLPWCAPVRRLKAEFACMRMLSTVSCSPHRCAPVRRLKAQLKQVCVPRMATDGH